MGNSLLPPPPSLSEDEKRQCLDFDCSIQGIADYIKDRKPTNIVLMIGAGVSVSAGIPDFRSPGSGLYNNLQRYNLSNPELMFNISFFRENPAPFYDLARSLFPSNFTPAPFHFFIKLLQKKNILRRCYTQNIDTLERQAGVDPDLLVEAHGSFGSAHCTICDAAYSQEYFRQQIFSEEGKSSACSTDSSGFKAPWCYCAEETCRGNVKPDIVFFGENLPSRYFELREADLESADLLIVAGTSLSVAPFADKVHLCPPWTPRLLLNNERVGRASKFSGGNGFKFDMFDNYRDVELLGPCDDALRLLCDLVGWRDDLEGLISEYKRENLQAASSAGSSAASEMSNTSPLHPERLNRAHVFRNQRKPLPSTSQLSTCVLLDTELPEKDKKKGKKTKTKTGMRPSTLKRNANKLVKEYLEKRVDGDGNDAVEESPSTFCYSTLLLNNTSMLDSDGDFIDPNLEDDDEYDGGVYTFGASIFIKKTGNDTLRARRDLCIIIAPHSDESKFMTPKDYDHVLMTSYPQRCVWEEESEKDDLYPYWRISAQYVLPDIDDDGVASFDLWLLQYSDFTIVHRFSCRVSSDHY